MAKKTKTHRHSDHHMGTLNAHVHPVLSYVALLVVFLVVVFLIRKYVVAIDSTPLDFYLP